MFLLRKLKNFISHTVVKAAFVLMAAGAFTVMGKPADANAAFKYKNYYLDKVIKYKGIEPQYVIDTIRMKNARPAIIEGTCGAAMCGANEIFRDCIGAEVKYNKKNLSVTFDYNGHHLVMYLNERRAILDDVEVVPTVAPFRMKYAEDNTIDTFVPSKWVAGALGLEYEYRSSDNSAYIRRPHEINVNESDDETYFGTYGRVFLDDYEVLMGETPSYIMSDTAMVNAKKVLGLLDDTQYYYNRNDKSILIEAGDIVVNMKIGDRNVYVNGVLQCAPLAPVEIYDSTFDKDGVYIPGRYIFNLLGMEYEWDATIGASRIKNSPDFGVFTEDKSLIRVFDTKGKNEAFSESEQLINIPLPSGIEQPEVFEDIYKNCIFIDIKGDYSSFYRDCDIILDGNAIEQLQVYYDSEKNITRLKLCVFNYSDDIFPAHIKEFSDNSVNLHFNKPKMLYDKIIVLDAGHGAEDPGTVDEGYNEKDLNFSIVNTYCKELFDASDIKVFYTRYDDTLISLNDRAAAAGRVQADMFISVHNNYADNKTISGSSVYYSPTNESMYSFNGYTGKQIAQLLLNNLTDKLGTENFGLGSRELSVTKYNTVPAALIECGFMSNHDELMNLLKPKTQEKIAKVIFKVVNKIYDSPRN